MCFRWLYQADEATASERNNFNTETLRTQRTEREKKGKRGQVARLGTDSFAESLVQLVPSGTKSRAPFSRSQRGARTRPKATRRRSGAAAFRARRGRSCSFLFASLTRPSRFTLGRAIHRCAPFNRQLEIGNRQCAAGCDVEIALRATPIACQQAIAATLQSSPRGNCVFRRPVWRSRRGSNPQPAD